MDLTPITEDRTPESEKPSNDSSPPGAVTEIANISDQLSNSSETNTNDLDSTSPVGAPAEGPVEAPIGSPVEAPVGSPVEAPVGAPAEGPAEGPVEAPVGSPEMQNKMPYPGYETPLVAPSANAIAENPPFLKSGPPKVFTAPTNIPSNLQQAINFRRTLKHKKRAEYDRLSDSEKLVAKKHIVDNLIHVLRSSTNGTTFKHHKKSIVKLRHTLNKHLDYIERKKRVKSHKKSNKNNGRKTIRSKSIR